MNLLSRWLATFALASFPTTLAAAGPDFDKDVLPIFQAKCNRCHGEKRLGGKLDMRTVAALLKGGVSGPAIVPGNVKKSLMLEMLRYDEMPPRKEQPRITADELKLLREWVEQMPAK